MTRLVPRPLLSLLSLHLLAGCATSPRDRAPEIETLYAAAVLDEVRNPVVVIHGILGSRLERVADGRVVWGAFTGECVDPGSPDGARAIALPMRSATREVGFGGHDVDGVVATGPLEKIDLDVFFGIVEVDVYRSIIRALGSGGYRDTVTVDPLLPRYAEDHFTCFSFFYDWRRDNVANAIELGRYLRDKRSEVELAAQARITRLHATGDPGDAREAERVAKWLADGFKFDVVAHSMGGLVARYYLRYGERPLDADGTAGDVTWAGAEQIDRLVMVGTPNLGSAFSMVRLIDGFRPAPITPRYSSTVLGTMPSIYQLLPRSRHGVFIDESGRPLDVDLFDAEVWIENRWGLASPAAAESIGWLLPDVPESARRAIATSYLRACLRRARDFHRALDTIPATECPSELSLFAGDVVPTLARVRLRPDGERLEPSFDGEELQVPGDGTVPRYSALGDERWGGVAAERRRIATSVPWDRVVFLPDDHIGLTMNPTFVDNLLYQLLEEPLRIPAGR